LVPALGVKKTKLMGLKDRERNLMIASAIYIEYTDVTDRHRVY